MFSLLRVVSNTGVRNMCSVMKTIDTQILESTSRQLAPPLTEGKHKGQAGRVGIVGGSLEYTGAPYFAGISGLKLGADLIHIFCAKEAAPVIKSYSPELIVHPILDDGEAIEKIEPWLERLHVLVIGPGLGRDQKVLDTVENLISVCRSLKKPLVIDADGLFLISQKPDILKDYPGVILTPNAMEYVRLKEGTKSECENLAQIFGDKCVILKKGKVDEIFSAESKAICSTAGSGRRCGGQGDLLSGSVAVFYYWALINEKCEFPVISACYAACKLTRQCNARAFKQLGRSMTTSNMIEEIGTIFNEHFEVKENH